MIATNIYIKEKFAKFAVKKLAKNGKICFKILVVQETDVKNIPPKRGEVPLLIYLPNAHFTTKMAYFMIMPK